MEKRNRPESETRHLGDFFLLPTDEGERGNSGNKWSGVTKANTPRNLAGDVNEAGLGEEHRGTWSMQRADTHRLQPIVVMCKCSVARSCDLSAEARSLDIPVKLPTVFNVGN